MFLSQISHDAITSVAKEVAGRDDRYLLLVLFFGSCFALYFMARFFILQYERMTSEHRESRQSYGLALQALVKEGHEIQQGLAVKLTEITEVLRRCATTMELCAKHLADDRSNSVSRETKTNV